MTGIAVMGTYYKTFEAARKAFSELSDLKKKTHVILTFGNGFLIVGKLQLEGKATNDYS